MTRSLWNFIPANQLLPKIESIPLKKAEAQHFLLRGRKIHSMHSPAQKIIRKILKVAAWLVASVVLLLIVIALLIQIPAIQLKLTQRAITFLEDKIGTNVSLEGISIRFPKSIILEGIYLEDQQGDTLLYAGKLAINTDLWALTKNRIQLNDVALENTVAFIDRQASDSAFNFTYILDAFAGDSTAIPDTLEQQGWDFALKAVELESIRLRYEDLLTGNHARVSLGNFALDMNEFDITNNRFGIGEILLENTRARFKQTKIPAPGVQAEKTADSTAALILSLESMELTNVDLAYEQSALGQKIEVVLGQFALEAEKIDLENQIIELGALDLHQSEIAYRQDSGIAQPDTSDTTTDQQSAAPSRPWVIALGNLDLSNNSIIYANAGEEPGTGALDFNNLHITAFNVDARNLRYEPDNIVADLRNISFQEKSGFVLKTAQGKIEVTGQDARLRNFLVETGNSRLALNTTVAFPSLQQIGTKWPQAEVKAEIENSWLGVNDVSYFQPSLLDSLPVSLPPAARLRFDADLQGSVADLTIQHLTFEMLSETTLQTSGTIRGLPDANRLSMNLTLDKFYSTRGDLEAILPDSLLPDSMNLPAWINLAATFEGTPDKAVFTSHLTSASGTIDLEGDMNLDSASAMRGLHANLHIQDLDVGDILGKPDTVMGSLDLKGEANLQGLTPEEMTGTLSMLINRFEFQKYTYKDLNLQGRIENELASLNASMEDQNLNFTLDADYDFREAVPRYNFELDVKNADFQALKFSKSPIRGRGTLLVDIATSDFKRLNGDVGIRKVAIFNGDELYAIDSLLFASIDQEGKSEITIDSDLLSANFEGSINIFSLPGVVTEYFNSYYSLNDSLDVKDAGHQRFSFNVTLKNTDILTGLLVPELTTFVPGEIKGEFDSEASQLDLRMDIDDIQYSNIGIRSLVFSTNSDTEKLNYNLHVGRIMIDSTRIDGLEFNGTVSNDAIRTDLIILDSADTHKYVLAGTFFSEEGEYLLKLLPEAIVLNYQQWSVPTDNFMRFGGAKFVAENVQLTNRREKIIIESKAQPGSPIFIGFRELNLEYLSSIIAVERPLSGLLQGDVNIYSDSAAMAFTSDITIDDLRVQDIPWGNLSLQVEQTIANRFDVDFGLTGNGNDVSARGYYQSGESSAMNLILRINQFDLASLQPVVGGQLQNLTGRLQGELAAKGTPETPDIDGRLQLNDTRFFSTFLNTSFSIDDESISFLEEGISFNAFEIADESNHKARLSGAMLTRNYRDFQFNLDLFTDQFRLLDTEAGDNELFYGLVEVSANARIRGDMNTPVVNVDIRLNEGSDLTYVVPQSEAAVLETEGIVRFVDKTFQDDPFVQSNKAEATDTVKAAFRGIDLTARIELSDEEKFTIIIEPVTQDQLTISGNSTLTLGIDPTGDIQLSGRYEISEGTYNLSFYKFVKREFSIESGSTITWSGDPLNASMDIRAIYAVETAPLDLFSNQLTGADASEVNRYKQRLPFLVYLNITGQLLQPEIAFELDMPMDDRNVFGGNVYARLQDINTRESDLNKQVFALLILKRFVSDNPFENQAAGGFESTARRSVSKILSEQLNRLSENIKGVELSFDIKSYEDYTSGQAEGRTELELGFSKSLLNDRLVVKLSGNIDIEGEDARRDATDYIGDLALEYKLTPDGRFRITGFRNSNYDMIDGELTETGAGLIYVKDYNSLSELFKANAETRN